MTSPLLSLLSPHLLIAPGGVDCKFALNKKNLHSKVAQSEFID
jgi:hypothetical protein